MELIQNDGSLTLVDVRHPEDIDAFVEAWEVRVAMSRGMVKLLLLGIGPHYLGWYGAVRIGRVPRETEIGFPTLHGYRGLILSEVGATGRYRRLVILYSERPTSDHRREHPD